MVNAVFALIGTLYPLFSKHQLYVTDSCFNLVRLFEGLRVVLEMTLDSDIVVIEIVAGSLHEIFPTTNLPPFSSIKFTYSCCYYERILARTW